MYRGTSDISLHRQQTCRRCYVGRQIIYGDANIILCDGVTLTVNYGIAIANGASLTLWSQKEGTGGLRVENIKIEEESGIHGFGNSSMTINGGNIYAEGYKEAVNRFDDPSGGSGIYVPKLTINGGSVTAVGGWHASGIGGGNGGHGGTITINGGTVDAVSGGGSAGIGGGYGGSGGNITINGGTVVAAGYNGGAGIGGGDNGGSGGNIAISGGNVTANSYYENKPSYGIGAGGGSSEANVTLSWTNETDSIYANSYGGKILLLKPFIDEELYIHNLGEMINGKSEINGDINAKTLTPGPLHMEGEDGGVQKISSCIVKGIKAKTYNGKAQTQSFMVIDGRLILVKGEDYTVSYKNNKNAGKASVIIKGMGNYKGTFTKTFKINKAKNPVTVKTVTKTVKLSKVKKAKQTVKPIKVSKAKGKVTYKLTSVPKSLGKLVKINSKGVVTISKWAKAPKGTYKIKVKITAKGNKNYKLKSLAKTVTIKVK